MQRYALAHDINCNALKLKINNYIDVYNDDDKVSIIRVTPYFNEIKTSSRPAAVLRRSSYSRLKAHVTISHMRRESTPKSFRIPIEKYNENCAVHCPVPHQTISRRPERRATPAMKRAYARERVRLTCGRSAVGAAARLKLKELPDSIPTTNESPIGFYLRSTSNSSLRARDSTSNRSVLDDVIALVETFFSIPQSHQTIVQAKRLNPSI
ncbi:hypothetical protein EVAR_33815_1 [Eumeta japonica]|uniref:Uncharacterized protein n=1 Tax=Eumeta variegata TaxID=151549 RepID=A0A4C1VA78_EUMVA|nr:hypothetical protein EVAR_33815_1 [Eumeta japonica]